MTELRKFRQALGMSRNKLASELGGSHQNVARYEAEMTPEFREQLAVVAERNGRPELASSIRSGDEPGGVEADLACAIERLIEEWRRGGQKWKAVYEVLGDTKEGKANAEAHGEGRADRPRERKAG